RADRPTRKQPPPDRAAAASGADDQKTDDAVQEAAERYAARDFDGAADRLRRAARSAPRREADRLTKVASGYERVGRALASGRDGDPPGQLKTLKAALALDDEWGDGEHQALIEGRIAQVAPRAAGSYMAAKRYADARAACDDAERHGAADAVERVRASLER